MLDYGEERSRPGMNRPPGLEDTICDGRRIPPCFHRQLLETIESFLDDVGFQLWGKGGGEKRRLLPALRTARAYLRGGNH